MNKLLPILFYGAVIYLAARFGYKEETIQSPVKQEINNSNSTKSEDSLANFRAPMLMRYAIASNNPQSFHQQ